MYCHRCGNNLPPQSQFCNRCGSKVLASSAARGGRSIPRPARRRLAVDDEYAGEPYYDDEYDNEYDAPADLMEEPEAELEEPEEEETIFTISPAFYGIVAQYVVAMLLSVGVTAGIAYLKFPLWIALAVSAVFFIRPIYHHVKHHQTVYKLTTVKVEIKSGLFSKTSRNIPLRHIQDVTVSQTFSERMIGVGDVVIDSAAVGGKILMPNIKDPRKYSELILNQLQYWN